MNERVLAWIGVGTLGALWGLCIVREAPSIEASIGTRSIEALTVAGIATDSLTIVGRHVTWRGDVLDVTDAIAIGTVLEAVRGVRSVQVIPTVRPPTHSQVLELRLAELTHEYPIQFAGNSPQIFPATRQSLDIVADVLAGDPGTQIIIEGHTDSRGDPQTNRELSQQRAEAVRRYFILRGIAPERLEAKGFGDSAPIAENSTAAGRRANRRIVFRVKE